MRLTIIPSDGVVGVDRVFRAVDMSGINPAIHAVQFDDAAGEGEIEYQERGKPNERITSRAPFAQFVARWTAAAPPPPSPPPPPDPRIKAVDDAVAAAEADATVPQTVKVAFAALRAMV